MYEFLNIKYLRLNHLNTKGTPRNHCLNSLYWKTIAEALKNLATSLYSIVTYDH